jgi:hypothetical protein
MAILISNVTSTLQKVIMPFIQDNFDKKTILLDQLKRNKGVTFMNDYFYAPIRTSRHGGVVNLANDGNSLLNGSSSTSQASVTVKVLTGSFQISKLTMEATKTAKGAVENELIHQAKTLASDFAKSVNRQYYSDGYGAIGMVGGSVGAGTIGLTYPDSNLDDGRSIDWYGSVNGDINPNKYIQAGQILAIGTAGADLGTVTSVSGTTVVVTGNPAIVAYDTIYLADGDGEGAGTSEIQGMRLALTSATSGTYAGIAQSTTGWTAQVGTTAEALTLSAIEDKYLAAKEYADIGDRYAIFVNKSLYKKYGDILISMRRAVNETELLGGWTGLEFAAGAGRVGVFLDYDVPDGEVLIVNLDSWIVCQVADMAWMEDPNGGALIRSRGTLLYEASMAWFTNLICVAPAANGRLTQKTD